MIPQHARPLFWDIDVDSFDPRAFPRYTIERVLEYGSEDDLEWMRRTFAQEQILDVLRTDRRLTPLSANFWALYFGIPPADVASLKEEPAGSVGLGPPGEASQPTG